MGEAVLEAHARVSAPKLRVLAISGNITQFLLSIQCAFSRITNLGNCLMAGQQSQAGMNRPDKQHQLFYKHGRFDLSGSLSCLPTC